jgi:hypothetical protein
MVVRFGIIDTIVLILTIVYTGIYVAFKYFEDFKILPSNNVEQIQEAIIPETIDISLDKFLENLKGKKFTVFRNNSDITKFELEQEIKSMINNEGFDVIFPKGTLYKLPNDTYKVPLYIKHYNSIITKRAILYIGFNKNELIVKDITIPIDLKEEFIKILPSINDSSFITSGIEYKDIPKSGLNTDDKLEKTKEEIIRELHRQELIKKYEEQNRCYGTIEFQKIPSEEQCKMFGGVWDREVKTNEECPFYKKNINYLNSRGGIIPGGKCELPIGMKLLGYRYYSLEPDFKPFCYGCKPKNSLGQCCDEQEYPDYAFVGDRKDRILNNLDID